MSSAINTSGVVRGRVLELADDPGLADGEEVAVTITVRRKGNVEALRRAFGGWADHQEGLDEYLAETRAARKLPRRGDPS